MSFKNRLLLDFGIKGNCANWTCSNDGIIGGKSFGKLTLSNHGMILKGAVTLVNKEGFITLQSPYSIYNLMGVQKMEIRYRADKQRVKIALRNHKAFDRPSFQYVLPMTQGVWKRRRIRIQQFQQSCPKRKSTPQINNYFLKNVIRMYLSTADKKDGEFEIEIDYIKFY